MYLAYGLIREYAVSENRLLTAAACVVFVLGGGLILITSLRRLAAGDYDDGMGGAEGSEDGHGGQAETGNGGRYVDEETVKDTEREEDADIP